MDGTFEKIEEEKEKVKEQEKNKGRPMSSLVCGPTVYHLKKP